MINMALSDGTLFDQLCHQLYIMANHGKDEDARKRIERFILASLLMSARDFWTYLYDWFIETTEFLKSRKIIGGDNKWII